MSTRIGVVRLKPDRKPGYEDAALHVWASTAGVELHSEPKLTLSPEEARDYAALLVAAAHRAEIASDCSIDHLTARIDLLQAALSEIEHTGGGWAGGRASAARVAYRELCEEQRKST
jgi:hypothetical protein